MRYDPRVASERISTMADESIVTLIAHDLCPICMGALDAGYECRECEFDSMALAQIYGQDRLDGARKNKYAVQ